MNHSFRDVRLSRDRLHRHAVPVCPWSARPACSGQPAAGCARPSRRGTAARRGLRQSRRETAAAAQQRDDLIDQRETARAYTASKIGDGAPGGERPAEPGRRQWPSQPGQRPLGLAADVRAATGSRNSCPGSSFGGGPPAPGIPSPAQWMTPLPMSSPSAYRRLAGIPKAARVACLTAGRRSPRARAPGTPPPGCAGEFRGVGPDRIGRAPGRRIHGVGDLHAAWCRPGGGRLRRQPLGRQAGRAAPAVRAGHPGAGLRRRCSADEGSSEPQRVTSSGGCQPRPGRVGAARRSGRQPGSRGVVLAGAARNGDVRSPQAGFAPCSCSCSCSCSLIRPVFTLKYSRLSYSGHTGASTSTTPLTRTVATSPTGPSRRRDIPGLRHQHRVQQFWRRALRHAWVSCPLGAVRHRTINQPRLRPRRAKRHNKSRASRWADPA